MRDAGNKNDSHRVHWMACLLCNGRDVRVLCCGWWQYLRMHSTRSEKGERRIWTFPPKIFEAARAAFHLRYSLLSYIYTSARQAYDSAVPLNRYDRIRVYLHIATFPAARCNSETPASNAGGTVFLVPNRGCSRR